MISTEFTLSSDAGMILPFKDYAFLLTFIKVVQHNLRNVRHIYASSSNVQAWHERRNYASTPICGNGRGNFRSYG